MVAIEPVEADEALAQTIITSLRYTNPAYVSQVRFGSRYAKKVDKFLYAYIHDEPNKRWWVPRAWFFSQFTEADFDIDYQTVSIPLPSLETVPTPLLKPLPHQMDALTAFINKVNENDDERIPTDTYIVLPPSGGKTVLGMLCAFCCTQKTLVVVPTREIEEAWVKDATKVFGTSDCVGIMRGKKLDLSKPFTVGSIQTLMKLDPTIWADKFGMVIFDELHRLGADVFANTVKRCRAHIRLGLTATDFRRDGRFVNVRWHLGDPCYRTEERHNAVPLVYHPVLTKHGLTRMLKDNEDYTFNDLLEDLQNNQHRNNGIVELAKYIVSNYDGDILIVSPRTNHIVFLEAEFGIRGIKCAVITGTTKNRKEIFQKILEGEYPITIATTSIMSEGASNPRWHHVISTMPFSDPKTAIQLTGRAIRKAEGKKYGYFWDLVDVNPMCRSMYKSRWRAIKKFLGGHKVHDMSALPPYTIQPKAS